MLQRSSFVVVTALFAIPFVFGKPIPFKLSKPITAENAAQVRAIGELPGTAPDIVWGPKRGL